MIPEQWYSALQLPPKTSEMCWWDKDESKQLDLHMESGDEAKQENIRKKDLFTGGDWRIDGENIVGIRIVIVIKSKGNI